MVIIKNILKISWRKLGNLKLIEWEDFYCRNFLSQFYSFTKNNIFNGNTAFLDWKINSNGRNLDATIMNQVSDYKIRMNNTGMTCNKLLLSPIMTIES